MKLTFIESAQFSRVRDELLGGDAGYRALQAELMVQPDAGDVIPGTGGIRKYRVHRAGQNKGKSGGARVIYLYIPEKARIVFYLAYAKNVATDLTSDQKKALKAHAEIEKVRP